MKRQRNPGFFTTPTGVMMNQNASTTWGFSQAVPDRGEKTKRCRRNVGLTLPQSLSATTITIFSSMQMAQWLCRLLHPSIHAYNVAKGFCVAIFILIVWKMTSRTKSFATPGTSMAGFSLIEALFVMYWALL